MYPFNKLEAFIFLTELSIANENDTETWELWMNCMPFEIETNFMLIFVSYQQFENIRGNCFDKGSASFKWVAELFY